MAPSKTEFVIEALTRDIRSGKFKSGEKLPSLRELGKQFNVSTMVLHQASIHLEELGLIDRSNRSGLFISEKMKQRELCGFTTSVRMGRMDGYFESFMEVADKSGSVPMTVSGNLEAIEWMLEKSPLRIFVDLEGKMVEFSKLRKLLEGHQTIFCHRFEWIDQKPNNAVLTDWISVTEQTLRHLLERGHRKIVFLSHDREILPFKRLELEEAARRVGLCFDNPEFQWCGRFDFEQNPQRLMRIFKQDAPTAIFSRSDSIMFEFSSKISAYFPETAGIERIGAYNTHWSQHPGNTFSSWSWDWREFWTKAFAHDGEEIEYYMPKLILR
ncbi:MAG: GntR family transcriptional regulator [Victivallales bacterium]|jgi:DNA-binding transcriptional regulator YhcF (GntR family)|nr:GntR family transcriptional regulator [Victivallales bacterium]